MKKPEMKTLKLTNARVKYAKVHRPGKAYDENHPDEWSVNIYPTDADRDTLMAHGCNPKEDKDGQEYWIAKRSTRTSAGEDAKPPIVLDAQKQPFTDDIGNGSVCNIAVTLIPWEKAKRKGIYLYLNALQVVNHVPYSNTGADVFGVLEPNADTDAADML
jgi:hypothetical protein